MNDLDLAISIIFGLLAGIFVTLLDIRKSIREFIDDMYEYENWEEFDG